MTTELQTQEKNVPSLKRSQTERELAQLIIKHKDRILDALPQGVNGELVLKKAIFAIRTNDKLIKCSPASLFWAIAEAISNGLEIGGVRREAYLVPYGDECVMLPGYRGLLELVRRSGQLEWITVELVHAGDEFEVVMGDEPKLNHKPSSDPDREKEPVTHVYLVAMLKSGERVRNVWTAAQINAHRDRYSKAYQNDVRYIESCKKSKRPVEDSRLSPWSTNWRRMAFKTVIKDTINQGKLPMSESLQKMVERDTTIEQAQSLRMNPQVANLDQVLAESLERSEPIGITHEVGSETITRREEEHLNHDAHKIAGVDWIYRGVGCDSYVGALECCKTPGEVTVVLEYALISAENDDDESWAKDEADKRRLAIREAKSEA